MNKKAMSLALGLSAALLVSACNGNTPSSTPDSSASTPSSTPSSQQSEETKLTGSISMSGSTSMEEYAKAIAEAFNEKYPDVSIDVQLGGSSTGAKNAMEGVSDIGNLSRSLKDTEAAELDGHIVAIDGIGVILNTANKVENLTMEQLLGIYTGTITDWSEVGGDAGEIVVVGRESGSGTRDGFESVVGIEDNAQHDQELTSTGAVKTAVSANANAIGYVSFSYADDTVKLISVDEVACSVDTIKDGSYKLQRPFVMATKGELSEPVQALFDFIYSEDGAAIATDMGLIPSEK
jgi:phosphate transport system substrate-binding protein